MKDIGAEAILFDMYYMAKDPVLLAGEKRETPKAEMLPVTEATPQFRDFYVKNVVCDGAAKAIFIRGLPEMNIKDIYLKDLVIRSKTGVVCQEATNVAIKNLQLINKETNPVISILNSRNVSFDALKYTVDADLLMSIEGDRSSAIQLKNTDSSKAKKKVVLGEGVKANVLE